jgi:excinuclease ABC subunit A
VITGISGSGKSSLAFDLIYAEGQRRYLESFSAYARQFIGSMERPDVDKVTGLSPVISIEQKTTSKNPRSTVGTVTEINDFLRLLFARAGKAVSHVTGNAMVQFTEEQIIDQVIRDYEGKKILLLAPLVRGRKGHYRELFEQVRKQGYVRIRVDGDVLELKEKMQVDRYKIHDIELVVDRLEVRADEKDRLRHSLQDAMKLAKGMVMVMDNGSGEMRQFSKMLMDPDGSVSYEEPSPNSFSFNSPYGYCPHCKGIGVVREINDKLVIPDWDKNINEGGIAPMGEFRDNFVFKQVRAIANAYDFTLATPIKEIPEEALQAILHGSEGESYKVSMRYNKQNKVYTLEFEGIYPMVRRYFEETSSDHVRKWAEDFMDTIICPECEGKRLRKESLHFLVADKNIADLSDLDIGSLSEWFLKLPDLLDDKQQVIAKDILKEINERLGFLNDVGLTYLSLSRPARTLSSGESQRIRLATQIGSRLMGITYILDEPSIGLHQRDNRQLINSLMELRDIGNTVLVVEHDKEIMEKADWLLDLGPGAGSHGGKVVAEGDYKLFMKGDSGTAQYLSGEREIEVPKERRKANGQALELHGAKGNNLKGVDVRFPAGNFICVTGVSGSGKSTMVNETLYPILNKHFYRARKAPLEYKSVEGLEHFDKVIEIDQSPIGRTPRSNPATYIGVFTDIRSLFAGLPESKVRGYKPGRFSFNMKGGRCEVCEGAGMKTVEMNFLPDVYVHCERCFGKRYNRETLEVRYKGKSISDVLEMSVEEAVIFFENIPNIYRKTKTLQDVGLGYITLGQSATTLSGGEAQRVKLAEELSKKDTGRTFYILDEPTTGLHFQDIQMLLKVLNTLVDRGNTVLVIEHNLDVIKVADHIIDIGPEGGEAGGTVVATGTPEEVAKNKKSHTGKFLAEELAV